MPAAAAGRYKRLFFISYLFTISDLSKHGPPLTFWNKLKSHSAIPLIHRVERKQPVRKTSVVTDVVGAWNFIGYLASIDAGRSREAASADRMLDGGSGWPIISAIM